MAKLSSPQSYKDATDGQRAKVCNGCGTRGIDVPDTIWGLCITESCYIHDWEYKHGKTWDDKKVADKRFLTNMLIQIEDGKKWWWLRRLRKNRAYVYYTVVKRFGGVVYRRGKNL
jgi:hypothetical protein